MSNPLQLIKLVWLVVICGSLLLLMVVVVVLPHLNFLFCLAGAETRGARQVAGPGAVAKAEGPLHLYNRVYRGDGTARAVRQGAGDPQAEVQQAG